MFQSHSRNLWFIAAAVLGRPTHAADAVQEAAAIALTKLDQFDPGSSFAAWMGQIVRFVSLNAARRQRGERERSREGVAVEQVESSTRRAAPEPITPTGRLAGDHGAFDDDVTRALETLDETARACLLLRTVGELSYREIAEILSIPEGTAMSHVHRARHSMRAQLQESRDDREARR